MNKGYTEIDGKFYQEHQLIILPTENATHLMYGNNVKEFEYYKLLGHGYADLTTGYHMYFFSDEEIKEGWYVDISDIKTDKKLKYFSKINDLKWLKTESHIWKLIIATTDSELKLEGECKINSGRYTEIYPTETLLPRPSNSFIEKFVSEWNASRKIDKVLIEVRKATYNDWFENEAQPIKNPILKVAPDNTITIKPLVVKDSWSREEVILFGSWYSGMKPEQVKKAFNRYLIEQNL